MRAKSRQDPRFEVLGRVQCQEISALPGNLIDISAHGCKIFYSVPVTIHLEDDYTLLIQVADSSTSDFTLICHPVWVNEDSGQTVLGMTILRSPDSERLKAFVESLESKSGKEEGGQSQIVDSQCQFI
ncbi:MAG: PilZ domain-containing protein [Treponema sp.]|nr:PilZ domain-containing protein [Treponema sp.]MEE3434089.1 PilZ domain-containing protein [Treponema sp.]